MRLQRELGATTACTVRCAEGSYQGVPILTVKGDAWFGSVKYIISLVQRGQLFVDQVKSNHGLFPKDYIEEQLLEAPGGIHFLLKATHKRIDIITVGYRNSSK